MRFSIPLALAMPLTLALAAAPAASAQPVTPPASSPAPGPAYGCPGMRGGGYGMMGGAGMMGGGYGMMGHHGMMGAYGPRGAARATRPGGDLNLSVDEVRKNMADWLARMGNPHLTVGPVAQVGPDTINAEIVTKDNGGVVQRFTVNRHTGATKPG